jgi:hypothetical protein
MATTFKAAGPHSPTNSVAASGGYAEFRNVNTFSQNYVFDKVLKDIPISPTLLRGGASGSVGAGTFVAFATGDHAVTEINSSGMGGIYITDTNDRMVFQFTVPVDMDPNKEFAVRYRIANADTYGAATSIITTKSLWRHYSTATAVTSAPTVVFSDTTNTTTIQSVQYSQQWLSWDSVNDSAVAAAALVPGDDTIMVHTVFTLATSVTAFWVTSIELGYYKKYQA